MSYRHLRQRPGYSWLVFEPATLLQVLEEMNASPELLPCDKAVLLALMASVQPRTNSTTASVAELQKLAGLARGGWVNGSLRRLQKAGLVVRTVVGEGSTMAVLGWMLNPAIACCGGTSKPIQQRWERFRRLLEESPPVGRRVRATDADVATVKLAGKARKRARLRAEREATTDTTPAPAAA